MAGGLGTLGGVVATAQRFAHILAALGRMLICFCADHDPGNRTDDRALHGAAYHGCLLIAKTSCEMRNVFLDRALIVETMANERKLVLSLHALPTRATRRVAGRPRCGQNSRHTLLGPSGHASLPPFLLRKGSPPAACGTADGAELQWALMVDKMVLKNRVQE
jgi:hypothetical protein